MVRRSLTTIVVGPNNLRRESCIRVLRSANFRIVDSVSRADDLRGKDAPSLFLIVHAGNECGSLLEQIRLLTNRYSDTRVVVVADRYRPDELASVVRAGASGYFIESITLDAFIRSLELVMGGQTVLPTTLLPCILGSPDNRLVDHASAADEDEPIVADAETVPQLSPREALILSCLIEGESNKTIARKLNAAEATVKVHVKAILRKIRVHNRTQAAIWGMKNRQPSTSVGTTPATVVEIIEPSKIEYIAPKSRPGHDQDTINQANRADARANRSR